MTGSKNKQFGEKAQASLLDDEEFLPKVLESYLQRFLERELPAFLGAERYALTCFQFPKAHAKKLRTTNGLERLNEEIARRSKVVGTSPTTRPVSA